MPLSRKYSFPSKQIEKLYKACETYIQRPMQWDKWIAERWLLIAGGRCARGSEVIAAEIHSISFPVFEWK